ncbi:MAG: cytochrome c peroxidase, partial [Planctomycetaceae bacterium]
REQVFGRDNSSLIVADAFSGRLAVIDSASRTLTALHEFGAHNIRGLAIKADTGRLLISHQLLNHKAVPRRSDIIWGVMVDNTIRELNLHKILQGQPDAVQGGRFISVGYAGQGAGDPDSLFVDDQGRTVIALAGVGEVSIVESDGNGFRRVAVGRRPVALMPVSTDRFVAVNELSDSLSLIDLTDKPETQRSKSPSVASGDVADTQYGSGSYGSTYLDSNISVRHLPLGQSPPPGPVERGEALFFDARVSHANWFSCHSCHTDGHSNGGLADTSGDNSTGAPKRVLSLLGVGETGPWGWNGGQASLAGQVQQSSESTMKGHGLSATAADDVVAFLKTLTPPPPFQKIGSTADSRVARDGRHLFESFNCTACHAGRALTSSQTYDVGLVDEQGLTVYSPPSLRGVGHRSALFHDGRAVGVREVVTKYRHQLPRKLNSGEQQALIRYLNSL